VAAPLTYVPDPPGYLVFAPLAALPGLVHGVFTRHGGVSAPPYATLNVSLAVGDDPARVLENRRRVARALGGRLEHLYTVQQVHGAAHRVVDGTVPPASLGREPADILLTGTPGVLLLLKFADCVPLLYWDPVRRWVALAHAGWRGTALNVAGATVQLLTAVAGSRPGDLWVALGPAIGRCCYIVGPEVVAAVSRAVPDAAAVQCPAADGRAYLDLVLANVQQLLAAGVPPDQVVEAQRCTACESATFFSHRALGMPSGRFAVVAGVS
jgi:YfiH family protein